MFIQYFDETLESIWLEALGNLFQEITLDSLLYKDILEHEALIRTEPCFYYYKLGIVGESIVLRMDMNSNRNFKGKKVSEDDIPENFSEICEHSYWCNCKFDGMKLLFCNI